MPNPLAAGLAHSSRTALSQDSVMKSIRSSYVAASSSRRVSVDIVENPSPVATDIFFDHIPLGDDPVNARLRLNILPYRPQR
ncbi:hypothetical protein RHECIAT_CH0001210 [Rhizobium etli CIAT 652]|uniref:Uncharacterized protein n=1 Tax=Rhizobium etli (strain CIAT 652) TaxID=491916 RepID=B3PTD1_RHIE6|nr:hypothetical protein RHECIAT_CH0001210 [Rhizobium etli CIAT 652]